MHAVLMVRRIALLAALYGLLATLFCEIGGAQGASAVPVFDVVPVESAVKFSVKASVGIEGTFDKWDAKMTFTSPDVTTARLDIKIQAASVNTGSGMKNNKLKGKDFFYVEQNP